LSVFVCLRVQKNREAGMEGARERAKKEERGRESQWEYVWESQCVREKGREREWERREPAIEFVSARVREQSQDKNY